MAWDVLASFCNVGAGTAFGLGVIDLDAGLLRFVDLTEAGIQHVHGGVTGLSRCGDGYAAALQGDPGAIVLLTAELAVNRVLKLSRGRDLHSLLCHDDALLVVSTGTDEIIRVDLASGAETVVYTAAGQGGGDTVHLNAACLHQGRLLASMFGPAAAGMVRSGQVIDIGTGARILGGLRHPHSLRSLGETIQVLESATGSLIGFDLVGNVCDPLIQLAGYCRGLCEIGARTVIGRSRRRVTSRGQTRADRALLSLPTADGRDEHARSALLIHQAPAPQAGARSTIELTAWVDEIYDLLPLPADITPPLLPTAWQDAVAAARSGDLPGVERLLQAGPPDLFTPARLRAQAWLQRGDPMQAASILQSCSADGTQRGLRQDLIDRAAAMVDALRQAELRLADAAGIGARPLQMLRHADKLLRLRRWDEAAAAATEALRLAPERPRVIALHGQIMTALRAPRSDGP